MVKDGGRSPRGPIPTGTRPGHSQHVGDDPHAPHVCGERDELIVDNLWGQELGGSEVHLQLLPGLVPGMGGDHSGEPWDARRLQRPDHPRGSRAFQDFLSVCRLHLTCHHSPGWLGINRHCPSDDWGPNLRLSQETKENQEPQSPCIHSPERRGPHTLSTQPRAQVGPGCLRRAHVGSSMLTMGTLYVWGEGTWAVRFFSRFFCETKTALKHKVLIKKIKGHFRLARHRAKILNT